MRTFQKSQIKSSSRIFLCLLLGIITMGCQNVRQKFQEEGSSPSEVIVKSSAYDGISTIMAHRGGQSWAPENTLAAFKLCADNNIDWETDLNLTADGEIVLMHDMTLDRTTNACEVFGGSDIAVNSKTLAQIKTLDAGSSFSSEYAGEKVPTLDEFLDCFVANAPSNSVVSMDTKIDKLAPGTEVYQSIIDKIADRDLFDRVFIEVFEVDRVNFTKKLKKGGNLKYAIWVSSKTELLKEAVSSGYFSRIHVSHKIASMANEVHVGGIPCMSAFIDNQEGWDSAKIADIDAVTVDYPDVAMFIIRNEIPGCNIMEPIDGLTYKKGASITISAGVADSDSSISKVEFYQNGRLIGQDVSRPYIYSWLDIPGGSYSLTAKVYDNGLSKVSEGITISVK